MIHKSDQICDWVEMGVLSYKICNHNFDCKNCPLDRALRSDVEKVKNEESLSFCHLLALKQLMRIDDRKKFFVNPQHIWIDATDSEQITIGIDDVIALVLGSIDGIELPELGTLVERGSECGRIAQSGSTFSLRSPLTGKITSANHDLKNNPNILTLDPLNHGWLAVLQPEQLNQELSFCFTGNKLFSWYQNKIQWLESKLTESPSKSRLGLGKTMADGGEISYELRHYIQPEQYRQIIDGLLGETIT